MGSRWGGATASPQTAPAYNCWSVGAGWEGLREDRPEARNVPESSRAEVRPTWAYR